MHAGKKNRSGEPAQPTSPPAKAAALSGSPESLGALSKSCERPLPGMLPETEESISGAQAAVVCSAYEVINLPVLHRSRHAKVMHSVSYMKAQAACQHRM